MSPGRLQPILQRTVEAVRGAFAAALFEDNGILVAVYSARPDFHVETAADAFVESLRAARQAVETMGLGGVQQLIVETPNATLLIHPLFDHYSLGLGLERGGNLGQARLTLKRLEEDLLPVIHP
jgi:predicted regulator of Ras-like GTPase activity (Roadblock/LC7/MglB family)